MTERGPKMLLGAVTGALVAAAAGFAFGFMEPGVFQSAPVASAPAPQTVIARSEVKVLPPIIANLANGSNLSIRLEAAVVLKPDVAEAAEISARISDDLVTFLKTVSIREIEGPTGFQLLKNDLKSRASRIGDGKTLDLLILTFVVQ
ncbi:flagellar basal body-associated FliL family protein [Rhodomicrobium lacus]|uniref:flagellar basal body-associated FliL family protein n=1 Tax=Rhodomicrobium lacus TaxID=2498452 RepID=UPI0026E38995|nr:flagellar basal body-associated FliL family protein [Rhodomicrobium lacus]WKW50679.1 flagellar basal body-associated FliL family protein [Rhodomicrobium lacus]